MATVQAKLKYLIDTKDIIKRKIQYFVLMPDWTPFRKYADYIGMIGSNVCAHDTSVKYIPAPRIRTSHTVELPAITHESSIFYLPTPRIQTDHTVTIPEISQEVVKLYRPAKRHITSNSLTTPSITHETEVLYSE